MIVMKWEGLEGGQSYYFRSKTGRRFLLNQPALLLLIGTDFLPHEWKPISRSLGSFFVLNSYYIERQSLGEHLLSAVVVLRVITL